MEEACYPHAWDSLLAACPPPLYFHLEVVVVVHAPDMAEACTLAVASCSLKVASAVTAAGIRVLHRPNPRHDGEEGEGEEQSTRHMPRYPTTRRRHHHHH